MKKFNLILLLICFFALLPLASSQIQQITMCGVLANNNAEYQLQNDIYNVDGNQSCITITGNNTVFDGNGYSIGNGTRQAQLSGNYVSDSNFTSVALNISRATNVTVYGLTARNITTGIYMDRVTNSSIYNNQIVENVTIGVFAYNSSFNFFKNLSISTNTELNDNGVTSLPVGFTLSYSYNNMINDTFLTNWAIASALGGEGYWIEYSDNNTFWNNIGNGTDDAGFALVNSNYNQVINHSEIGDGAECYIFYGTSIYNDINSSICTKDHGGPIKAMRAFSGTYFNNIDGFVITNTAIRRPLDFEATGDKGNGTFKNMILNDPQDFAIYLGESHNLIFKNITIIESTPAADPTLYVQYNATNISFIDMVGLSSVEMINSIIDLSFEDTSHGKVFFNTPIFQNSSNISSDIVILDRNITVNASKSDFNTSINLTFYTSAITSPIIYRDGNLCDSSDCVLSSDSTPTIIKYQVTTGGEYFLGESPASSTCSTLENSAYNLILITLALLILVMVVVSLYNYKNLSPKIIVIVFVAAIIGILLISAIAGVITTNCG